MSFKMIVTPGNNSALVKRILLARGNWEAVDGEQNLQNQILKVNFVWSPNSLPLRFFSIVQQHLRENSNKIILFNHFQNHRIITTKVNLIRTLKNYYNKQQIIYTANYGVFITTPTTFIITVGAEDKQYNDLCQRYSEIQKSNFSRQRIPAKHCKQNLWLVKPANMNQGRGIQIFKHLKQITGFLASKPLNTVWVVQKYIEKPLLYHNRKFDIRVWVIVTNKCQIYFYRKGYIRTSSDTYSMDNFNNYVHLTNNCLQKFGSGYSKFQDGNTLPIEILQQYINGLEKYKNLNFNLQRDIISRIKDLIIDTIVAGKKAFNIRKKQFELFGYDFLVDQDLRTWLIQVNTNPYLGIPNDYIKDLLNLMVDDMLKIVVDPIFPPKNKNIYSETNNFELIYSQDAQINLRSSFSKSVYPFQELMPAPNKVRKIQQYQIQQRKPIKQYSLEQHLKNLMQTYMFADFQPFQKPLSRILSNLMNWELQSEQNRTYNCKLLKMIFQSRFNGVFIQQNYLESLVKIIDSQNFPTQIQTTVIEGLITLCKNIEKKKKIISPLLITALVKIALSMFDQKEYKQFDKNLIKLSLKCLIALAGVCEFKYFIPGQTRESQVIRQLFIKYNGLCIIILALKQDDFKDDAQQFLSKLDIRDWEFQLMVLKQEITELSLVKSKLLNKLTKGDEILNINLPIIMKHKNQLRDFVQNKLNQIKENILKRQQQQRQKRQKFQQMQQKMKQEKEHLMQQRKLKAELYMRKKNQQRMKQKMQQQKRLLQIKALEEERKKKLTESMQKRKQQLKIIRNDSLHKMQKEEKQRQKLEKEKKQRQKEKYSMEQRNRILTQWLEGKKQQQKKKKQQQKQQEAKRMKMMEERKVEIEKRIQKLKDKNKKRGSFPDKSNPKQVDRIIINSRSKSILPKVPKSERQIENYRRTPRLRISGGSIKDSEEQLQHKEPIIKVPIILKQQNEQHRAFKYFLHSIKKAAKQKKIKVSPEETQPYQRMEFRKDRKNYYENQNHEIYLLEEEINRKLLSNSSNSNTDPYYHTSHDKRYSIDKKEKNQAHAVVDFLLSSPYSSFVKKHYKIKQLLDQLEKQ